MDEFNALNETIKSGEASEKEEQRIAQLAPLYAEHQV